jgi:hypothetical protein
MGMRLFGCVPVASPNFLKPTVALMKSRLRRPASLESSAFVMRFDALRRRATAAFAPCGPASKTNRLKNISIEMWSPPQTCAALISYIKPLEIPYMAAITLAV